MGNKTLRAEEQQQLRGQQETTLNSSIRSFEGAALCQVHHNYNEKEIIEGDFVIVNHTDPECFIERRKKIPLTLVETREEISAIEAVKQLENSGFRFTESWCNVARRLGVNQDKRIGFKRQLRIDNDYKNAMESSLDQWIRNDSHANWDTFTQVVSFYEANTGKKLRKSLQLYSTDMKQSCGKEFIIKLTSQKLKPCHFQALAPYLLSEAREALIIEHEPDEDLRVLRMLQHWVDCWKEKATYEALICVVKDALPSEPEIIEFVESTLDNNTLLSSTCTPEFIYILSQEELQAQKDAFEALRWKFVKMISSGATFLIAKEAEINLIELKFMVASFYNQPVEAENISQLLMNFIAPNISMFNYELFERFIVMFGDDEHKQQLEDYKADLDKYNNHLYH